MPYDHTKMPQKVWAKIWPNITLMKVCVTFPLWLLYMFFVCFLSLQLSFYEGPPPPQDLLSFMYMVNLKALYYHHIQNIEFCLIKRKMWFCSHYLSKVSTVFFFFFKSTELTGSWNYILAWSKSGPKESLSITPCPVEDTSAFWTSSSLEIAFPKKTESSTTNSTHISDRLYPPSKSPQNRHKETGTHMHMYTHNTP